MNCSHNMFTVHHNELRVYNNKSVQLHNSGFNYLYLETIWELHTLIVVNSSMKLSKQSNQILKSAVIH